MEITITDKAKEALDTLVTPLHVEMELYFSCLIRKQVLYPPSPHPDAQAIEAGHSNLRLYFRPVMTKSCQIDESHGEPDLVPFPMQESGKFQPKWFTLDFKGGHWQAAFGYSH